MYKKLILTFTLAAGLSVLPNAFAAPSTKPGGPAPKPNTTNTIKHGEDSVTVLADFKKGRRPPPVRHGEDSINVLAADIPPAPEPKYKRPGRPPPKGRYGEDSATVLAKTRGQDTAFPTKPRPPRNHGEDSTIV